MNDKIRLLQTEIRHDLQAIHQAYERLRPVSQRQLDRENSILVAYYLHVIYGLFENMFMRVATSFGTAVEESGQWHAALLRQMAWDIPEIRPAVIQEETGRYLDELRRFRHLFRNAYVLNFDPERLQFVLRDANRLELLYQADIEKFLHFLDALIAK